MMMERNAMDLVLSLFPGIGMLDRAFEQHEFCVVRGPDLIWGGDIRTFHPPAGKFDGVIGGPPCQTFSSLANLVRARGYEPRFGNLIPEFERCIAEAEPAWFLMENVPAAPEPVVAGYAVHSFLLDNAWLPSENGFGEEQRRRRRFSFGVRGEKSVDLRRWLELAALEPPDAAPAVVSRGSEVMVKLGGSGKVKRTYKEATVSMRAGVPAKSGAVTSGDGGGRMSRYKLPEACRLQGLPENFLEDAPFTAQGKLKAVANGVPLPMGRALAKAIDKALAEPRRREAEEEEGGS